MKQFVKRNLGPLIGAWVVASIVTLILLGVVQGLPWVISTVTITQALMAGNKHPKAWVVAIGSQVLWSIWVIVSQTWGLIPLNIALWAIYIINHYKWSKS